MSGLRRLVVFGDSFVSGYRASPTPNVTELNFPYYLSEELGIEVINKGQEGRSNLAIASEVLSFVRGKTKEDLSEFMFLIVYSQWERDTIRNQYVNNPNSDNALRGKINHRNTENSNPHDIATLRVHTELAYLGIKQLCEMYDIPYRMINSYDYQPYLDKLDNIECIKARQLKKGALGMVDIVVGSRDWTMINSKGDDNWIESRSLNNTLLDICSGQWLLDEPKPSPFEYLNILRSKTKTNKYLTPCGHPNVGGNKIIAKTLAPYLKELIKE